VGQTPLYETKEIQNTLAYLWFVANPNSGFHLERILNQKKVVFSLEDLDNFRAFAAEQDMLLGNVLSRFEEINFFRATQRRQLERLVPFLTELYEAATSQTVSELIELVRKYIKQKQTERIDQFKLAAVPFENRLIDFLESTMLQKNADNYNSQADRVTLMTFHAAKGLEFPVVFMVGCEENLLPYQMEDRTCDLEEERRLFYVAMTRAQQRLILTYAKTRFLFGQRWENDPSPFVDDIENTLKELKTMTRQKKVKEEKDDVTQLSLF
jgi:DNA helicase-2/ATP-dependent DNA helicase PcrA